MSYKIGLPCIKLNSAGMKSKKCGDLARVSSEALEERNGLDEDINHSVSKQNEYLTEIRSAKELVEYSDQHCGELRDRAGRKLRSDAVRMIGTVIKPPADFMSTLSPEEQRKFLIDAVECLTEIIGQERIKAAVIHFDELVPHVHLFWEPMSADGFLCAKEVFNLSMLTEINKRMPALLRGRGWSQIDDCTMYDALEEKERINKQIEKYIKEHPEEEITTQRRNELFKKFKADSAKERREKNGKDSLSFKKEQERKLTESLNEKKDALSEIETSLDQKRQELERTENRLLTQKEEEKLGKKIVKALSEGKTSISVTPSLADKLNNSVLSETAIAKREQNVSDAERRLQYKEDEFEERVQKAVNESLPIEMKEMSNFKQEKKNYEAQIAALKKEKEGLLNDVGNLLKEIFQSIFRSENMPERFMILGKDYGRKTIIESVKEMLDELLYRSHHHTRT